MALIGSADSYGEPGILIPSRNTLFHWCLDKGLKLVQQLVLMTVGMYNEPAGARYSTVVITRVELKDISDIAQ